MGATRKPATKKAAKAAPGPAQVLRATLSELALAREAVSEVHGRAIEDEATVERFLADPTRYLVLALEDGRVVGSANGHTLHLPHRSDPQVLLYEIDVLPACRNRGIGTSLVKRFIEEARGAGAHEVWVLTDAANRAAVAMYERCGLRASSQDGMMLSLDLNRR